MNEVIKLLREAGKKLGNLADMNYGPEGETAYRILTAAQAEVTLITLDLEGLREALTNG